MPTEPIAFPPILTLNHGPMAREEAYSWYRILLDHSLTIVEWMCSVHRRRLLVESGLTDSAQGPKAFWRFHPLPYDFVSQEAWKGVYFEMTSDLFSGSAFVEHTPDRAPVISKYFFNSDLHDIRGNSFFEARMLACANLLAVRYDVQKLRTKKTA